MPAPRLSLRTLLVLANLVAVAFLVRAVRRQVDFAGVMTPGGQADLHVPPGFTASVYAEGLGAPRFLTFGPDGRLYLAESGPNRVVSLGDSNRDGRSDDVVVFAEDLPSPHSVVWHDGALYVGVPTGVVELKDSDADGRADQRKVLVSDYPTGGHSTRTVLFLGDGRLLVSVGSSCNVCTEDDRRRAALVAYDGPSAKGEKVFASGLRNAVGLAIRPGTDEVWATNNGRDWLGDDLPPDTINIAAEGDDFGWPRCHAGDLLDPEFAGDRGCAGVKAPAVKLQAHSAPLGLAFAAGSAFPADYQEDLFAAFHGSWNRSVPTGYKVVRVHLQGGQATGEVEDFATGFVAADGRRILGRPVGLAFGPDGALYVSDDKGGFVYRIAYSR